MDRVVEREWLDDLPPNDPGAMGSRRDLKRLNRWMGHIGIAERALRSVSGNTHPVRLVELGAGDGDLLLQVARRLGDSWHGTEAILVDRRNLLTEETNRGFGELAWRVELCQEDVFDWCRNGGLGGCDVVMANLFLHHFAPHELRGLLDTIRQCSRCFIAVEPRRSLRSLLFSSLVGFIGCNAVTRHDAPVSVRAGFCGADLSGLWSGNGDWTIREQATGPFSHLFVARKMAGGQNQDRA